MNTNNSESSSKFILCFDDTGSRELTDTPPPIRRDGMDCFGFGGILMREEDVAFIVKAHGDFCDRWKINYPLHSTRIRGHKGNFGWLGKPENAGYFMPELQQFLLSLPVIVLGVIIDRPGYFQRYRSKYTGELWDMDKTAFSILMERAAKFSDMQGRQLEVFFEQSGKREDRAIKQYMRELKKEGNPFNNETTSDYKPLVASDYRRIVLGEPRERTKKMATMQIADLLLYPIAKGRYDPEYRPYLELKKAGMLIDDHVPKEYRNCCGIKYSCFDAH